MAFSGALWNAVFVFVATFAHAAVTLSDFSGVWTDSFNSPTLNFFTSEGQGLICRETLSPECEAELTPMEATLALNETTFLFGVRERVGITDINTSAALHPSCAKNGIFPAERIVDIPPSRILSYDADEEKIYFVNPRRPDDINCIMARYRVGERGPYIETTHVEVYQGSIPDLFAIGFKLSCELPLVPCRATVDDGNLDFAIRIQLNLTCIAGDCLNTVGASSPSATNTQNESPVDV
eukprot:g6241.t1